MMEEDRRWGPDFMKYLYCCAKSGIDPTTNENVRKFLTKKDADFTKLDLNEDTFDWDKIEEAWDKVIEQGS